MSLEDILGPKGNTAIPKEARTVDGWAELWGRPHGAMLTKLKKAVANGLMAKGKFVNPENRRPQFFYWPLAPKRK